MKFIDEKFATIADKTSFWANTQGITGFMYGCAVSILSQVWYRGEQLRLWHNLASQLHGEANVQMLQAEY